MATEKQQEIIIYSRRYEYAIKAVQLTDSLFGSSLSLGLHQHIIVFCRSYSDPSLLLFLKAKSLILYITVILL